MIDKSFVDAIVGNSRPTLIEGPDGRRYSTGQVYNLPFPQQPEFPTIELATLDGLAEYVTANRDGAVNPEEVIIHCGARQVSVLGRPRGEQRLRDCLVSAECAVPEFSGALSFQDLESFRIALLTRFEDNPDRATILRFISRVQDEAVKTQEDDGVSQRVTVKTGVATMDSAVVPSPVSLEPFRTFTEIEQPGSGFIFRLQRSTAGISAALFPIADDWEARAAVAVRDYLDEKLEKFTVLA